MDTCLNVIDLSCGLAHFLHQWQTLTAGLLAFVAGLASVISLWRQYKQKEDELHAMNFENIRRYLLGLSNYFTSVSVNTWSNVYGMKLSITDIDLYNAKIFQIYGSDLNSILVHINVLIAAGNSVDSRENRPDIFEASIEIGSILRKEALRDSPSNMGRKIKIFKEKYREIFSD